MTMDKKRLLPFVFIFSFFKFGYAQSWWHPLTTGITGDFGVLAEATYNGELYVGGWFYQAGNVTANNMARWTGWNWDSVGSGLTGGENNVDAMCVYNGKLYVGGAFFSAEGLPANNIAVWDGNHWDTVGRGLKYCGGGGLGWADAMCVYNGKLYVAGAFCHAGGISANNSACWDGAKWDSVSSGINDSVYALAVYNGNLYAGGQFTRAGSQAVNNIAYWNGITWNAVGTGTNGPVLALAQYNNDMYAGGQFTLAGGNSAHFIAKWNGSAWTSVGGGIMGSGGVEALCVFNGLLYTGGLFNKSGTLTINNIATWNGTVWDTVGKEGVNNTVDAFAILDSAVFAGGEFTRAGNINALNIAAWGGVNLWVDKMESKVDNVIIYPNPNDGKFNINITGETVKINSVEVYNMLGEKVCDKALNSVQKNFAVNLGSQPAGIYLYRLLDESKNLVNQGKMIIR